MLKLKYLAPSGGQLVFVDEEFLGNPNGSRLV
jgi:hypothetical protein